MAFNCCKDLLVCCVGFLLSVQLLLPQQVKADDSPIHIGGLLVLSGQYAMQGAAFREGVELAIHEINDTGGIHGRKLEFIAEDTNNLPAHALTAARKLLQRKSLIAALTTSYPELETGATEFQRNQIPVVHLWDASPQIEAMGEFIFGIGPWTPSAGEVSADFARRSLHATSAVTFHINDPWSQLVTEYFEQRFKAQGGTILHSFSFNPQEQDFRSAFTKTRSLNPEVIYSPVGDNIVAFYTQLRQQLASVPVISSDVIAEEHISKAPTVFEGIYQSQMKDPTGPEMEKLSKAYLKMFNKACTLPWFVATAYDGVKLIAHCAKRVGVERFAIKDCIARTQELAGISQTLTFNAGGSSPQSESIFRLQQGTFVYQPLL